MAISDLKKLLGYDCGKEEDSKHHSRIVVFRKRLKTGEYLFQCRGYSVISSDPDYPLHAGTFQQSRDFAYAFRIVDEEAVKARREKRREYR